MSTILKIFKIENLHKNQQQNQEDGEEGIRFRKDINIL